MVEDRGPQLQAICTAFLILAVVSVLARSYVRARMVKWFGLDDWAMVAALLCYIMFAICVIAGVHYGTGRHFADLEPINIMKALRYWWLCYIAYSSSMIFAKVSIGYFLLRVTVSRIQRRIIYTMVYLTVVTGIVFLFVTAFQCTPISYFWERIDPSKPGHCINIDTIIGLTYFFSSVNALCDFTFGLLPVVLVWNLKMARKEKIALVPILGMGCVASTAVLVRLAFVEDFRNPDFLWATVDIAIWSDIEPGLAITAGSLACLRPLVQIVASKLGLSTGRTTHQATVNSVGHTGPTISGPFNLVSYSHGDKLRLGSQESSLEGGDGSRGDKTTGRVQVDANFVH